VSIKIFACGDIVNFTAKRDFVDKKLQNIIKNSDISICNFEAPIQTNNMKAIKKAGPHVYQSKESVKYLKNVGFDFVSLANNHIYDYGQEALEKTLLELQKHDIDFVGAGIDFDEAYSAKIIEKNNIKIGIIAACENEFGCLYENQNRGGYAWLFHPKIEDKIREIKQTVTAVVLIAHAGVEDINFPIKEWRDRYKRLCDIGVDVVIGHHAHVPQGYEKYNDSVIFYSLGNFYFDTVGFETKSDDSYSVVLEFKVNGLDNFEIVYHKKKDRQTRTMETDEVNFSLSELNNLLNNNYTNRNNDTCIDLFNRYYYSYYESSLGVLPKNANFIQTIKHIVKTIFFKNRNVDNRNLLLLHNIKIDSHRFVVQRALSLLSEELN
jgi:poly-gamma-glutamate synthesis protein (capsule biosynthesis protein)